LYKWKSVAAASSLSFLLPHCSGTYEYCKFSELTSVADPKQKFWLDPVSDPDPALKLVSVCSPFSQFKSSLDSLPLTQAIIYSAENPTLYF
jgi:hypothetical protein